MKILVYGSLNLDTVLKVDHFVQAGETLMAHEALVFPGGKGLNQAIAAARAGADVFLAGNVGEDGKMLLDLLKSEGIDRSFVQVNPGLTGAAYIQVEQSGQNCIVIARNANAHNSAALIESVLEHFSAGDILLLQNEINLIDELIRQAHAKDLKIYLNPSPFNEAISEAPLDQIDGFILNEVEGYQMTGQKNPEKILEAMQKQFPNAEVILTVGPKGALYAHDEIRISQPTFEGDPIDTTAAGDTFTGYYLACLSSGSDTATALRLAAKAASIAVTIPGATSSIPKMEGVLNAPIREIF